MYSYQIIKTKQFFFNRLGLLSCGIRTNQILMYGLRVTILCKLYKGIHCQQKVPHALSKAIHPQKKLYLESAYFYLLFHICFNKYEEGIKSPLLGFLPHSSVVLFPQTPCSSISTFRHPQQYFNVLVVVHDILKSSKPLSIAIIQTLNKKTPAQAITAKTLHLHEMCSKEKNTEVHFRD